MYVSVHESPMNNVFVVEYVHVWSFTAELCSDTGHLQT